MYSCLVLRSYDLCPELWMLHAQCDPVIFVIVVQNEARMLAISKMVFWDVHGMVHTQVHGLIERLQLL